MVTSFFLRYSSAALLAATLAGCLGAASTTIDVDDRSVFIPSVRVSVPLSTQQEPPSQPQTGHAIELGYTQAKGSSSQSLSPGQQPVRFGGQSFNSPRDLQYDFNYGYAEVQYRYRKFFGQHQNFGIQAHGGLVNSRLKLLVSSPGQNARSDLDSAGISGGAGVIWKFRPTTNLQSRYSVFETDKTRGSRVELFAMQALGGNAALRAGYTWWYIRADTNSPDSDIAVRFRGPAVALEAMF
jgi:hypothetical protein